MIECIPPPEDFYPYAAPKCPLVLSPEVNDECCEDVVARCYALPTKMVQHISFVVICEDKILLNRPPPPLEWHHDVEIWFGVVRLAHFTLQEWSNFQGRVRRILEDDDSDGHAHPPQPHTFFTVLRASSFFDPVTKSTQLLREQIHWILSYRQKLSLKECKMLEDVSAALNNRSNPPVHLRFKSRWVA